MLGSAPLRRARGLSRTLRAIPFGKTQKLEKLPRPLQPATEQRTVTLGAIPAADLGQIADMLGPALLVGHTQRMWLGVPVAR